MDQWITESLGTMTATSSVDAGSLAISLVLSFVLSLIMAKLYTRTHDGYSYSKSFVHTIVFVALTIDVIMIIIGSNIARAFALVGAMSIVRFRNPIKDSRDLVFLFMSIAIGMATGTQFYFFAILFTAFAATAMLLFQYFDFGQATQVALVLKLKMPETAMPEVERICAEQCRRMSIIAVDKRGDNRGVQDVVLEVELARGATHQRLVEALLGVSPNMAVSVLVGESSVSV